MRKKTEKESRQIQVAKSISTGENSYFSWTIGKEGQNKQELECSNKNLKYQRLLLNRTMADKEEHNKCRHHFLNLNKRIWLVETFTFKVCLSFSFVEVFLECTDVYSYSNNYILQLDYLTKLLPGS